MPFLVGVGYLAQRATGAIVRACGGSQQAECIARYVTAKLTVLADPIGTGVGMLHETVKMCARDGSEIAQKIDQVLDAVVEADADDAGNRGAAAGADAS